MFKIIIEETDFETVYIKADGDGLYWHRMNGPAYTEYETIEKKEVRNIKYYLYDRPFIPWWRKR